LNLEKIRKENIAQLFLQQGYKIKGEYYFREKKLRALHLEFAKDANLNPKVFISELMTEEFADCDLSFAPKDLALTLDQLISFRPWKPSYNQYKEFARRSEYLAWFYTYGWRPNHFTLSCERLKTFAHFKEFNDWLVAGQFAMNQSGGLIKGTPEQLLEQSSTLADQFQCQFQEGPFLVPSCYYEFAFRYADGDGHLFQGFLEKSADKIFESTHQR